MPGTERLTLAVHGDTGQLYGGGNPDGEPYLAFAEGDTVCVVVNQVEQTVAFYKNGMHRGVALAGLPSGAIYPCLGFELRNAEVQVNLGKDDFKCVTPDCFVLVMHALCLAACNGSGPFGSDALCTLSGPV
jgi:SPRY domain